MLKHVRSQDVIELPASEFVGGLNMFDLAMKKEVSGIPVEARSYEPFRSKVVQMDAGSAADVQDRRARPKLYAFESADLVLEIALGARQGEVDVFL